jgi:hypothetical protein
MHDGPQFRPIAEPLRLAAQELAELAELGDQLQGVLGRLTADRGAPDPGFITEAQAADLLSQRLVGMAAFLRALARIAPEHVMADVTYAVMDLTLAEQARRLSGPYPPIATDAVPGGELQLFGD